MTASADITVELTGGVLTATLTRAQKKNALTDDMYRQLADAVERAQADSAVRALIIRSEGDLFCAGNDLGDFAGADRSEEAEGGEQEERNVTRFLRALVDCDTPVIAAVQGKAVGVGTTMLLHCDVVLMTEDAQLITPFVNLALVPEAASSKLLVERVGHLRAFSMFVLGEPLTAQAAVDGGVANAIVPAPDLHAEADRYARRIAQLPAGSVTATKRLMRQHEELHAQMAEESVIFAARLGSAEAQEAFAAFAQKRKPDFTQFG